MYTKIENPDTKLCKDCKYYKPYNSLVPGRDQTWYNDGYGNGVDRCGVSAVREPVRGKYMYTSCDEMRQNRYRCGFDAKFFEPKNNAIYEHDLHYPEHYVIPKEREQSWYEFWKQK